MIYPAMVVGHTPGACGHPWRSRLAAMRLEFPLTSSRPNQAWLRSCLGAFFAIGVLVGEVQQPGANFIASRTDAGLPITFVVNRQFQCWCERCF
jgi:hypothetical protein